MVRIGKLPGRTSSVQKQANFELITVDIGGILIKARPYEYNLDPSNPDAVPTKLSTSCPQCGYGITVIVNNQLSIQKVGCDNCGFGIIETPEAVVSSISAKQNYQVNTTIQPKTADPFRNPLTIGLLTLSDLDPDKAPAAALAQSDVSAADHIAQLRTKPVELQSDDDGDIDLAPYKLESDSGPLGIGEEDEDEANA